MLKVKIYYFGIFDRNLIYFYLFKNDPYEKFDFMIEFNDSDSLVKEIKDINNKGIEDYLDELGIDLSTIGNQFLINNDFNIIGKFFSLNDKLKNDNFSNPYSRILKNVDVDCYNGVIQCLVNIYPLKDLFLNKNLLIKEYIDQKVNKRIVTINFYLLMKYIWKKETKNDEEQGDIFLATLQSLSKDFNIFNNIKLLIEFLLLSLHCEIFLNNENIIYENNSLEKYVDCNHKSFIRNLFFFNTVASNPSKCCSSNMESTHFLLYYNSKDLSQLKEKNINIGSILTLKINYKCKCKQIFSSKILFKTLPKILIFVFEFKDDLNIKFKYNKTLDIKKYVSPNKKDKSSLKYELISLIISNKEIKKIKTFCKSSNKNDLWYKYEDFIDKQKIEIFDNFNMIELYKQPPLLLIYQILENKS